MLSAECWVLWICGCIDACFSRGSAVCVGLNAYFSRGTTTAPKIENWRSLFLTPTRRKMSQDEQSQGLRIQRTNIIKHYEWDSNYVGFVRNVFFPKKPLRADAWYDRGAPTVVFTMVEAKNGLGGKTEVQPDQLFHGIDVYRKIVNHKWLIFQRYNGWCHGCLSCNEWGAPSVSQKYTGWLKSAKYHYYRLS